MQLICTLYYDWSYIGTDAIATYTMETTIIKQGCQITQVGLIMHSWYMVCMELDNLTDIIRADDYIKGIYYSLETNPYAQIF